MSEENLEVVRRWWEGFNENGMPPLALCDDEIEIRMPPDFPVRGLYEGHDGVRRWRDQVFDIFDNPRVEAEEIVDVDGDGATVLMLLRATGTASYTGISRLRVGGRLDDSGREAAPCSGLSEPCRRPRGRRALEVAAFGREAVGQRSDSYRPPWDARRRRGTRHRCRDRVASARQPAPRREQSAGGRAARLRLLDQPLRRR